MRVSFLASAILGLALVIGCAPQDQTGDPTVPSPPATEAPTTTTGQIDQQQLHGDWTVDAIPNMVTTFTPDGQNIVIMQGPTPDQRGTMTIRAVSDYRVEGDRLIAVGRDVDVEGVSAEEAAAIKQGAASEMGKELSARIEFVDADHFIMHTDDGQQLNYRRITAAPGAGE
jgi:hypothetical protein